MKELGIHCNRSFIMKMLAKINCRLFALELATIMTSSSMSPHNETFLEGSNLPIILLYKTREN
jgi:hypothetical protein